MPIAKARGPSPPTLAEALRELQKQGVTQFMGMPIEVALQEPWNWLWSRASLKRVCDAPYVCLRDLQRDRCGPCGIKLAGMGEEPLEKAS